MAIRGPRLEFAVGAFLLLALASLLVLALASTNRQFGFGGDTYPLVAKFTQLGQLRANAPVKIGGVVVGQVSKIDLDPKTLAAQPGGKRIKPGHIQNAIRKLAGMQESDVARMFPTTESVDEFADIIQFA